MRSAGPSRINVVTFCCLSDKVVGELQELFRESFSLSLSPYAPWDADGTGANPQRAAAGSSSREVALRPSRRGSIR